MYDNDGDEIIIVFGVAVVSALITLATILLVALLLTFLIPEASAQGKQVYQPEPTIEQKPVYVYRLDATSEELTLLTDWGDYVVYRVEGVVSEYQAFDELRFKAVDNVIPVPAWADAYGYPQTIYIYLAPNGMTGDYAPVELVDVQATDAYFISPNTPPIGC